MKTFKYLVILLLLSTSTSFAQTEIVVDQEALDAYYAKMVKDWNCKRRGVGVYRKLRRKRSR